MNFLIFFNIPGRNSTRFYCILKIHFKICLINILLRMSESISVRDCIHFCSCLLSGLIPGSVKSRCSSFSMFWNYLNGRGIFTRNWVNVTIKQPRSTILLGKRGTSFILSFVDTPHGMWDLSSLTRDWNHALRNGNVES